jgi:hypothetical protein
MVAEKKISYLQNCVRKNNEYPRWFKKLLKYKIKDKNVTSCTENGFG